MTDVLIVRAGVKGVGGCGGGLIWIWGLKWNAVVDVAATDDGVFVVYDLPDSGNANSTIPIYRHHESEHDGSGQPGADPESN